MSREQTGWLPIWAFPVGSVCGVRIRISLLFPLFAIILLGWFGVRIGLSMFAILLFAAMWHAQGRYLGACLGGVVSRTITLWPAGCLDREEDPPSISGVYANLGGLLANLLVCVIFALPLSRDGRLSAAMDPLQLGSFQLTDDSWSNVLFLQFAVNWMLVLVNLIPLPPFCAGRILSEMTEKLLGSPNGDVLFRRLGIGLAMLLLLSGLFFEMSLVVALAGLSLASLLFTMPTEIVVHEEVEETFLGYDFSEGYTSLNRSMTEETSAPPPSFLQRWRELRDRQRREREEALDQEVDRELDRILEKVHHAGLSSLTEHETLLLNRASERFRLKSKTHPEANE